MPAYTTKNLPLTYLINYQDHLGDIEASVAPLRDAPPNVFHACNDMPYLSRAGASSYHDRKGPLAWSFPIGIEEVRERTKATVKWVNAVHAAGVDVVIPYICNQTIGGDPEKRLGFWWFFDRWDDYAEDVGPKPGIDPIEWMQREEDGSLHFNYPYRFTRTDPPLRFAPCPNNPFWHSWLKTMVRLIASYGYDGTFVDNNIMHCRCKYCQQEFAVFLSETYTKKELKDRYGSTDPSRPKLATAGDVIYWACRQPEYVRQFRDKEPELFKEIFGTTDVRKAKMSEGGTGLHWMKSYKFWLATLERTLGEEGAEHARRVGDVSMLGVRNPRMLCRWADTQKFWAWTIARRNAELREAAHEVTPRFLIVPNWGNMTGFCHALSRCRDAKNVRLWARGTDLIFFEDEFFPGTLAPGYTLDLMISYKYAAACGIRSCVLPYQGAESRNLTELATAEAVAFSGDGAFVQMPYHFSEIRQAYRAFFEGNPHLFRGRSSYANVGLLLSFDEVHMENTHHLRESAACARYLAENHVLFDFLCEGQVTLSELARFEVVILPHVEYLPLSGRRAVAEYVARGGRVLVTGNTGEFDEHGRPVKMTDLIGRLRSLVWRRGADGTESVDYASTGRIRWLNDLRKWIPGRIWDVHDIEDAMRDEYAEKVLPALRAKAADTPEHDPRLLGMLNDLAGRDLSTTGRGTPPTLRANAWAGTRADKSIVLHLVNYNIPGPGLPPGEVVPCTEVEVRLRVDRHRVKSVCAANPWESPKELPFHQSGNKVRFTVPRIQIYETIHIQ
ncbi:MAG TPA: hypothetical protein P5179_02595 [Candidatus Latescibacteria bacterium]|nr:hypothetical protein [Candidatus Latescibacterota bacterium]HRS94139.1 hypothetical protein [Candidatus Latescibacterota bacterium]